MTQEALNIAGQCRATASSPLAKNILVDEGNGLLTELLLDAARIIEALAQPEQEPVIDKSAAIRIATSLGWTPQRTWVGAGDLEDSNSYLDTPPQRKPLSAEQVSKICAEWTDENGNTGSFGRRQIARAIEAAHNIKENT